MPDTLADALARLDTARQELEQRRLALSSTTTGYEAFVEAEQAVAAAEAEVARLKGEAGA